MPPASAEKPYLGKIPEAGVANEEGAPERWHSACKARRATSSRILMPKSRSNAPYALPFLVTLTLTSLIAACASDKPAPSTASNPPPASTQKRAVDSDEHTATIAVAEDIRKACGLAYTEARFSYNSAKLRGSDTTQLQKLADCFTSGPLRGRKMNLVGHADPRGEAEYNMALGGRRADSVEQSLKAHGLPESQVATTSRGALDATGKDEQGWAWDRRVDVTLAQ